MSRSCGCLDCESELEVRFGTCPECLPGGSIEWLIENGRQLELFDGQGVDPSTRGGDTDDYHELNQVQTDRPVCEDGLPF